MGQLIIWLLFLFMMVIMIFYDGYLIVRVLWRYFHQKEQIHFFKRFQKVSIMIGIGVVGFVFLTMYTQFCASTPLIKDEDGQVVKGSIAELKAVDCNGRKEWVSIRGHNQNNPILLFLAGGPGGSQLAATRYELAELEKHFVVVGWDQPGSGKSYHAVSSSDLKVATYIQDAHALTQYLKQRFGQEKIYLIGESWGSALGIFLAKEYPNDYHAMIGTGQMIDFLETEKLDYEKALEIATSRNDTQKVNKLKANGYPPYYGSDVTWKSAEYLNYLSAEMMKNHEIKNSGYHTTRDILASEYGMIDRINYLRGIVTTFNHVYPQLYQTDLRKSHTELSIPIYFFIGRHDINAPTQLVEDYYQRLKAPLKKLVWFEYSGHSPWLNETQKFCEEVLKIKKDS